ncbi:MAG: PhzF family phenazine biosynthesis protein, partial [Arenicellales bacterium]
MPHYLFDLYSAFTDAAFGGSHAGIIYDGEGLTTETMQQIAREVRAPATCFVMSAKDREVGVRFFSTAQEYPMCGHGTLALMTGLVSRGYLDISRGSSDKVTLRTPASSATVTVDHQDDGRIEVMLNLEPAEFEPVSIDKKTLERLFGAGAGDLDGSLPVEYTRSDFSHLVIPM